ncbi:MAG TPA: hypothetical protein VMH92_05305 [Acidocella sp.]|nr:hypothetical protein [Acidocella sp.]
MRHGVKMLRERARAPGLTGLLVFQLFIIFVGCFVMTSRELRPTILVMTAFFPSRAADVMRAINETALADWLGGGGGVFAPGRMSAHRIVGAIVFCLNFTFMFKVLFRLAVERVPGSLSVCRPGSRLELRLPI